MVYLANSAAYKSVWKWADNHTGIFANFLTTLL